MKNIIFEQDIRECHGPVVAAAPLAAGIGGSIGTVGATAAAGLGAAATAGTIGTVAATAAPVAASGLSLGTMLSIGSTVLGGIQSMQQSAAQRAQYEAQQQAAAFNMRVAQQNAAITRQQTQAAMDKQDRERRLRMGAARAAGGASGAGSHSFGDIIASSAMQEELDLLTIKSEGLLKERSYLTTAALDNSRATAYGQQAGMASKAGMIGAGSSILSGISKVV